VFQLVLPLHECANPTVVKPLHSVAEPLQSIVDSVADSTAAGAAPTETS
jgi:hypothetical protein